MDFPDNPDSREVDHDDWNGHWLGPAYKVVLSPGSDPNKLKTSVSLALQPPISRRRHHRPGGHLRERAAAIGAASGRLFPHPQRHVVAERLLGQDVPADAVRPGPAAAADGPELAILWWVPSWT